MLSYRHSFHAGNHADVLKHVVQSLIIESLKEKEKGFLYLDTHAGAGRYALSSDFSQKTAEYLTGIEPIWYAENRPQELDAYLRAVKHYNPSENLIYYPGSPLIAKALLREQDKLHLSELHPSDYPLLRTEFSKDRRATVVKGDGYQQIKAKLPPAERRGFVLIDPPYELKSDYQDVVQGIVDGHKRFATGVYAIWYPVVLRQNVKRMLKALEATGIRRVLQIELAIAHDSDRLGMTGSGMIVINPPWKLEAQMKNVLPWLHEMLSPEGFGHHQVQWVVPE